MFPDLVRLFLHYLMIFRELHLRSYPSHHNLIQHSTHAIILAILMKRSLLTTGWSKSHVRAPLNPGNVSDVGCWVRNGKFSLHCRNATQMQELSRIINVYNMKPK